MASVADTIKNTLKGYIPGDIHGPQSNLYSRDNSTLGQDMGYFGDLRERIEPVTYNGNTYYNIDSIKGGSWLEKDSDGLLNINRDLGRLKGDAKPLSREQQTKIVKEAFEPKLWNDSYEKYQQQRENPLPIEEKPYGISYKMGGTAEDISISKPRR